MQVAEEYERELVLEVHQRTKDHGFCVGWHNLQFLAVLAATRLLFYASVPVFWDETGS